MKRSTFAAFNVLLSLALIFAGLTSTAFGHGFTLSQINGQLVLDTQGNSRPLRVGYVPTFDPNTNQPIVNDSGDPLTFAHELDLSNAMNHGAFGLFANVNDALDLSDSYRLEFAGPLWYSNGGAAALAGSALGAQSFLAGNVALDTHAFSGNSPAGTMNVSAHSSHSVTWTLDAGAADGVYGMAYRVLWDDVGAPTQFKASNWVDLLLVAPNFFSSPNLLAAEQGVAAAAVPEPGSLVLGLLGVIGIGLIRMRSKR